MIRKRALSSEPVVMWEVHREQVYPDGAAKPGMSPRKAENFNRVD
jgi:hypothetical protein